MKSKENITKQSVFNRIMSYIYNSQEKDLYSSIISKELDVTYSHVVNVLQKCEELRLIETEKQGRLRRIVITDQGLEFGKACSVIMTKLRRN